MKKFLKWSAAFLVLGVLAVGCIKNEPSKGIEDMRTAKASLLTAQAALEQAKVQVVTANAALIQAQASLLKAQEAIIAAKARQIDAETALINAQVEWEKALTDYHKQMWALNIAEREYELEVARAAADAAIAFWELRIAQLQDDMVKAMLAYEKALYEFEQWKIQNADKLAKELIKALDKITDQIQSVIMELGYQQVALNNAKAQYLWYVNVEYPEAVENAMQMWEFEKIRLEHDIAYLSGVAEAYEALYNDYHGELDTMIAGFQDKITALRAEIAEMEIEFIRLQEEWLNFDHKALEDANTALTKNRTVSISGVFSDKGSDPDIHVTKGTYKLSNWGWEPEATGMFAQMDADILLIEETRAYFEDQDSGIISAKKKELEDAAKNAADQYKKNWTDWQTAYADVQKPDGALYKAWLNAWTVYDTDKKLHTAHLKAYKEMYEEAEKLICDFMDYLNEGVVEGKLTLPDNINISDVLGGINFNAGNLVNIIFGSQSNANELIAMINYIIGLVNASAEMDAIITDLKSIMDGTHAKGWAPFWQHATTWKLGYEKDPPYGDIMRNVYKNSSKEITELTKNDWYMWLFLYWLFADNQVVIGLENGGAVLTINHGGYTDPCIEVLHDFFGELDNDGYNSKMEAVPTDALTNNKGTGAIDKYYAAFNKLSPREEAMFEPFNRTWSINPPSVAVATKPADVIISFTPSTYSPPAYETTDPVNAEHFFFVLQAYQGKTGPIPSLTFDITYLDDECDLWVTYRALLGVAEQCLDPDATWAGDLRLWDYSKRDNYNLPVVTGNKARGHYYEAVMKQRAADNFVAVWNRVDNGEYAELIDKIQTLYDAQKAAYEQAEAVRDALDDELSEIVNALKDIFGYWDAQNQKWVFGGVKTAEWAIAQYQWLIRQANRAEDEGNIARDGLLEAWEEAEEKLLEAQQELRRIDESIAAWEAGLGLIEEDAETGRRWYRDFMANETAIYQARIDKILVEIENLQQKLVILEGVRAKLLEDYL